LGRKILPECFIDLSSPGKLVHAILEVRAKPFVIHFSPADADNRVPLGEQVIQQEVVKRRDELAFGEVAASAENNDDGWIKQ